MGILYEYVFIFNKNLKFREVEGIIYIQICTYKIYVSTNTLLLLLFHSLSRIKTLNDFSY